MAVLLYRNVSVLPVRMSVRWTACTVLEYNNCMHYHTCSREFQCYPTKRRNIKYFEGLNDTGALDESWQTQGFTFFLEHHW